MKLVTIIGTRPEIIRLACFIEQADKYFDHIIVHTGQNWDNNLKDIFFQEMKIRVPDYYLNVVGKDLGETMGNIISKSYQLLSILKPDCILILGDTNSGLSALSAKRLKIPIFHMEAGNRSFNENLPEEINRRIIDHTSDINLCYSENARRNLLREGLRSDHVFVTGSPLTEVLKYYNKDIMGSNILSKLNLEKNKFFLMSMHREENLDNDKNLYNIINAINSICEKYQLPIIFSTHPRTFKKIKEKSIFFHPLVQNLPAMGFFDYTYLQLNSLCVISDSGGESETASILNYPSISLRDSTERQEAIDKGNIILGNLSVETILDSIEIILGTYDRENKIKAYDYLDDNVSTKVIKIIQSYTSVINKVVWYKEK